MCIYMYIHVYIYMCINKKSGRTPLRTCFFCYSRLYECKWKRVCIYVCACEVHIFAYICIYTYTYMCVYIKNRAGPLSARAFFAILVCMSASGRECAYMCVRVRWIYVHTYVYTRLHKCVYIYKIGQDPSPHVFFLLFSSL